MITTPTVLILGAGSSIQCGYPLGRELVSQLCQLRVGPALDTLPAGWSRAHAERFLSTLSQSDPSSIDAFLERHGEDSALGKYLISLTLKRCERLKRLFPPSDAGWYRYLFDRLLDNNGQPRFDQGTLGIITFNYDRSLEAYIHTRLKAAFGMSEEQATSVLLLLPIVHVHGVLGSYPEYPYRDTALPDELLQISQGIQIIHEITDRDDGFCNDAFRRAHDLIVRATRVIFLGFGFHRDNMRRLRAFTPGSMDGKQVYAAIGGAGSVYTRTLGEYLASIGMRGTDVQTLACNDFFNWVTEL